MHLKFLLIFLFCCCSQLQAQNPPEVCARILLGLGQDSVTWQATPCVGFGGYVILGQENNAGPFLPLDTVMSSNFVNDNPTENLWNYQVGMLCSGVLTNLSTIVTNQLPITPDLRSVSIINNQPVISWDPSVSPEVNAYQLYKENPYGSGNFFPYPSANTFVTGLTYTDVGALDLLARYAIVAVSNCNKSLLGLGNAADGTTGPHTSMVVNGSIDTCSQRISFSWNAYENWKDGVQQYEIWLNRNGGGFQPLDTVSNSTLAYVYTNAQDGDFLQFQIRAVELNKVNTALSNTLFFNVQVNRPMDYLHITDLSVTIDNEIEIGWKWDTDVDFDSGDMLNGIDSNDLTSRLFLSVIGSSVNGFTDNKVEPHNNSYFYQIETRDACGHVYHSNLAETIFLEVEALENFENKITWNKARFQYATVQEYWLYKLINGSPQRIAILDPTEYSFIDQLDVTNEAEAENCYFVLANLFLNFPNGDAHFTQSQSNLGCATQGSNIHIPNAIAPSGKNRTFRPVIVFSRSIHNYTMNIFDRYGQHIFESNDLYDAWDGTKDGQPLKTGMYVYTIRFQAPDLTWIERKGTVMLVR